MSFLVSEWASESAPVADAYERLILMKLANHAHSDGRAAYPSKPTIARTAMCDTETVKRRLRSLESRGLIQRGDQRLVAHIRADRRPVVWDLMVPFSWYSPEQLGSVNREAVDAGRPALTAESRPDLRSAPERAPRADKGVPNPKRRTRSVRHTVVPAVPEPGLDHGGSERDLAVGDGGTERAVSGGSASLDTGALRESQTSPSGTRPPSLRPPALDVSLGDQQGTGTTTDGPNEFLDEQAEPAEWATALVVELNFGRHKRPSLGQVRQLAAAVQAAHERHSLSETEVKRHCRLTIEAATKSAVPYLLRGLQPDLLPAPTPRSHKPDLGSNRTTGPSPSRADEQDGARITLVDLSDPAAKVASALAEVLVSVRGLAASRAQTLADEAIRSRVEADQPITRETFVQAAIAACHQRPGKDSAHLRGRIERTAKFVVTS